MEAPKPQIDISQLLGIDDFKELTIQNQRQLIPPTVDNLLILSPKESGPELYTSGSLMVSEFFNLLKTNDKKLSNKEFINILNSRYQKRYNGKIEYSPKTSNLRDDYFFLLEKTPYKKHHTVNSKYLTWMYYSQELDTWKIDFGEIHGLQKKDKIKLVNQKGTFRITEVLPCQALIDDEGELDRDKFYQVDFSNLSTYSVNLDFEKSLEQNNIIKWFGRIEPLLEKWNNYNPKANLTLHQMEFGLAIKSPFFADNCIEIPINNIEDFRDIFDHVLAWEKLFNLTHPQTKYVNEETIEIEVFHNKQFGGEFVSVDPIKNNNWKLGDEIILEVEDIEEKPSFPNIQIKITNKSKQSLYLSALALGPDFSIVNETLPFVELEPSCSTWLTKKNGKYINNTIGVVMDYYDKGIPEETTLIKIILTNDDKLDTDFFCKGKPDLAAFKKDKVKAIGIPREELSLDWTVIDIPIKVIQKENLTLKDLKRRFNDLIAKGYSNQAKILLLNSLNEDAVNNKYIHLKSLEVNDIEIIPNKNIELENHIENHALKQFIRDLQASDLKINNKALLKTQNLLWYLQKFDFLEVSTEKPQAKPQDYTPQKIGETGYFTDPRDGQQYKIVMLKDRKIWMAENLNYDVGEGCWFYKNNSENGIKYGKLYNLGVIQKACPKGWYIPNKIEWENIINQYIDSREAYISLVEKGDSKFNALLGGKRNGKGEFQFLNKSGKYWSSSDNFGDGWYYDFNNSFEDFLDIQNGHKTWGHSLRCIKANPREEATWSSTLERNSYRAYKGYLVKFPKGRYTEEAEKQITKLQEAPNIITPDSKPKDYTPQEIGETGYFTDPRDGQQYKTVMLKDGKVWMGENLSFKVKNSWYHEKVKSKEDKKRYGRLYTWEAAKKACPEGWHLPSYKEWEFMLENYKGLSTESYKALIEGGYSGFSAQLGGNRNSSGSYDYFGDYGLYWSSTEYGADYPWLYYFDQPYQYLERDNESKSWGFSCRCLKD